MSTVIVSGGPGIVDGLDWKESCRVSSSVAVTVAGPGANIDGIAMAVDNRVLLTAQAAPAENGYWLFKGAAVAMERPNDFDTSDEVTSGATCYISEGTRAGEAWTLTTADPIVLGVTALTFSQTGGAPYTDADAVAAVESVGAISFAGGVTFNRVAKANADTPYAAAATDYIIGCNTTAGVLEIDLPAAVDGRVIIVADEGNNSFVNNVTIDPSGAELIDGAATLVININRASYSLYGITGVGWKVF